MIPLPAQDLDFIAGATASCWPPLKGGRILVTGATGFFGLWLLESLVKINREHGLALTLFAQSRDPARFLARMPHLGSGAGIHWLRVAPEQLTQTDVQAADETGNAGLDAIIHLATEGDPVATRQQPAAATRAIVGSTRQVLDLAVETRARYLLYTSSGAVYARPTGGADTAVRMSETHALSVGETDPAAGYAFSGGLKLQAEDLCRTYARRHDIRITVARGFTFVGPGMPLQGKFAMGNFLYDALQGRDIVIKGDGTAVRSYLYAADLAAWLWTILLRGDSAQAYNVGSEQALALREVAGLVRREIAPGGGITILGCPAGGVPVDYYVPDTTRARDRLGLRESIPLDEAVRRTAEWCRRSERR